MAFCLYLMYNMRRNLVKISSCVILMWFNRFYSSSQRNKKDRTRYVSNFVNITSKVSKRESNSLVPVAAILEVSFMDRVLWLESR